MPVQCLFLFNAFIFKVQDKIRCEKVTKKPPPKQMAKQEKKTIGKKICLALICGKLSSHHLTKVTSFTAKNDDRS